MRGNFSAADAPIARDVDLDRDPLFTSSLARGLAVLRCFSVSPQGLGTAEAARMTGLPQPTVWRLCHTMREMGLLAPVGSGDKLRLGIPVLGLGFAALADLSVAELALPYMQDLAERFQGAVSLGARQGLEVVYVQRSHGLSTIFSELKVGSHVSILKSPTGWACLAGVSLEERRLALAQLAAADPGGFAAMSEKLEASFTDCEVRGYLTSIGLMHPKINAVSVPVRSRDGRTALGLTCGGIASAFPTSLLEIIGPMLVTIAEDLALALEVED